MNINPRCIHTSSYSEFKDFLFFQTNENGNWEIAFKTKKDSVWSNTKFVDVSSADEITPSLLFDVINSDIDSIRIL